MCGHKGEKLKKKNCGLQKYSMSAKLQKKDDFTLKFMPPRVMEDIIRYQKLFLFKIIFLYIFKLFYVLISIINFKKLKKYYFDTFLNKKNIKSNR